jgi:hypothetical protein
MPRRLLPMGNRHWAAFAGMRQFLPGNPANSSTFHKMNSRESWQKTVNSAGKEKGPVFRPAPVLGNALFVI